MLGQTAKFWTAVTNARFASLHGLPVVPFPLSTTPVPLLKPRARHELAWCRAAEAGASVSGPAAGVAHGFVPLDAPLRLRSTCPARRPQTEAKQERFDHAFVLSKLTQRIE